MKYLEMEYPDSIDHILYLTKEEQDELFEPFDPNDDKLASHLHYSRFRYIKTEPYDWLVSNIAEVPTQKWQINRGFQIDSGHSGYSFVFADANDAMKFKLRWAL